MFTDLMELSNDWTRKRFQGKKNRKIGLLTSAVKHDLNMKYTNVFNFSKRYFYQFINAKYET